MVNCETFSEWLAPYVLTCSEDMYPLWRATSPCGNWIVEVFNLHPHSLDSVFMGKLIHIKNREFAAQTLLTARFTVVLRWLDKVAKFATRRVDNQGR